jgi:hypothetical protein
MIAHARLQNQRLSSAAFTRPEDVVRWMGAVQAQEYPGAKWALALRMRNGNETAIEQAFAAGQILRTHLMRPTWHFVAPSDIRWILALTASRVRAALASYDRQLGIDARLITRSNKIIAKALAEGNVLTREELKTAMRRAGIAADSVQRLTHLVLHAELDAVVCSGPLRGKQFTYALLDERVPATRELSRDNALAELARRYFISHGPAQLRDFVWWSGLRVGDARVAVEMAEPHLTNDVIDDKTYWSASPIRRVTRPTLRAYLLPVYDEYLIAYKDRSASLDVARWKQLAAAYAFTAPVVLDGQVVGGWKRTVVKGTVRITLDLMVALNRADQRLVADAVHRYAEFIGVEIESDHAVRRGTMTFATKT